MKCKQEMGVDPKWRKVLNYKSGRFPPAVINEVVTVGSNPQLCQPYEDIMSIGVYSDAPQQVPAPRTRDIRQGIDEELWHRLTPYYLDCQPVEHFARQLLQRIQLHRVEVIRLKPTLIVEVSIIAAAVIKHLLYAGPCHPEYH